MKRKITVLFSIFILIFCLSSCVFGKDRLDSPSVTVDEENFMIYWLSNGGDAFNVDIDGRVSLRQKSYILFSELGVGEHTVKVQALSKNLSVKDSDYGEETVFTVLYKNLSDIINEINLNAIKANFMVKHFFYNRFETVKSVSQGSSIIYKKSGNYYYLLTNNHVVYSDKSFHEYTVTDCYNNSFDATLLANSAEYDLAVLKFKSDNTYPVLEFSENNSKKGSPIISLGQPLGQMNSITIGKTQSYEITNENSDTNASNVRFEVMMHTAPIEHGSSGGAVLDYNLNIVGINYASSMVNDKFANAFSIPIIKVKEFLTINNLI